MQHLPSAPKVRRRRRRQSPTARDSQRNMRAPCQQPNPSRQSHSRIFLLAYRDARWREHCMTLHRVPEICQQTTCTSVGAQDNTTRVVIRHLGTRHGGSFEEVLQGWSHRPPSRSRQIYQMDRGRPHHQFDRLKSCKLHQIHHLSLWSATRHHHR